MPRLSFTWFLLYIINNVVICMLHSFITLMWIFVGLKLEGAMISPIIVMNIFCSICTLVDAILLKLISYFAVAHSDPILLEFDSY